MGLRSCMAAREDGLFDGFRVRMLVKTTTISSCAIGVVLCAVWEATAIVFISCTTVEVFGAFSEATSARLRRVA